MTGIARIETAGPERRARRIVFDDGAEPRITSAAVVKSLGLEVGVSVDPTTLEQALHGCEYDLAKERALQLLGYRERSSAELVLKLDNTGYPHDISVAVMRRFVEVELVDDTRFASVWVRSRRAAGYGARRIARELHEKGVDGQLVEAVLEQGGEGADQLQAARAALRGRVPRDRAEYNRLVRRLVSRGFELSVALEAVGRPRAADANEDE